MNNLKSILLDEKSNKHHIYLYESEGIWHVYERSAYHFLQIFLYGTVTKYENYICIEIDSQFEFLNSAAMHSVEVESIGNDQIVMNCIKLFPHFESWKQEHLNQ